MSSYTAKMQSIVIDSGFASSSILTGFSDATALTIYGPATLTGTVTVRIATGSTGVTASETWTDYNSGGSDITIATGGNSAQFTPPSAGSIILVSAGTEAARRIFAVSKQFSVGG